MRILRNAFELKCPKCESKINILKRVERTEKKENIKTYICGNCDKTFQIKDELRGIEIVRTYV